jgi:hypothetical protein
MRHDLLKKELTRVLPERDNIFRLDFIIDCLTSLRILSRPPDGGEYVIRNMRRQSTSLVVTIPEKMLLRGTRRMLQDYIVSNVRQSMVHHLVNFDMYESPTLHSQKAAPGPKLCDLDWVFDVELQAIRCSRAATDAVLTQALQERLFGETPEKVT